MSETTVPRRRAVRGHQGIYFRPQSIEDFDAKPPYEFKYKDSHDKWVGPVLATLADGLTPCATLKEVKECKARYLMAGSKGILLKRSGATLGEYIDQYIAKPRRRPLAEQTVQGYKRSKGRIPPILLKRKIADVRVTDLEDLLVYLSQPRGRKRRVFADTTLHTTLTVISGAFSLAMRNGECGANPVKAIDKDSKPRPKRKTDVDGILQPLEIKQLLEANMPEWTRAIIWLAIFSGLRQSELLGLRWGSLDLDAGIVKVRGQLTRTGQFTETLKTEASRRDVRIDAKTVKMLREWWMRCGRPAADRYLFESVAPRARGGVPFTQMGVWERFATAVKVSGIRQRRFHDLRHTFASILIANGCSVKWVQLQMGHSTPSITLDTYTSLWNLEADQARHDEAMEKAQLAAGL